MLTSNMWFVLRFLRRVLSGERFREATPQEFRTDGASLGFAGLIGLLLLAIDPDVWTAPPVFLWTGVVLSLVPLAVFFWWIYESVPPTRSVAVGLSIPLVVLGFSFLCPRGSVPVVKAAQGGLILYVVLMVLGPKTRMTGRAAKSGADGAAIE